MRGKRNPFVAHEGLPSMALVAAAAVYLGRFQELWMAGIAVLVFVFLFLLFRDPHREVPTVALGIVSPVDGEVVEVEKTNRCVVQGEAHRVKIRINPLGAYTARSPIEGRVMDLSSRAEGVGPDCPANALWVETDEGSSVVLQFHDYGFGIPPRSFVKVGERVGQGDRCAYIRLARYAELYLPIHGKVYVQPGQRIMAGTDLIGAVPHP